MTQAELAAHLETGSTTTCRAWQVTRPDGVVLGFTDHDGDLLFDGVRFVARTGLTARALQQTTGMSVDNSEALGALSDASVREEDIAAGRYDGAEVTAWLVNWADVAQRTVLFRGSFGEITRAQGAFRVELRGLAEQLNVPLGRAYHPACSAALGDRACGIDLSALGMSVETELVEVIEGRQLRLAVLPGFSEGWFALGRVQVLDGVGAGQRGVVRKDATQAGRRVLDLWNGFGVAPEPGDRVRIEAGCDKQGLTCRTKFSNFLNFRGFPHIPGEDWLRANPTARFRR